MIAEQHIHSLDVMAWIKKDVYPTKCYSLGGRQKRTEAQYGVIYDHFSTVYEWADGTRGFSYCRQQDGTYHNVNEYVLGTEGKADVFAHQITGKTEWQMQGKMGDMYQNEHDEMFAAIRAGKQIDNSHYMCESTLMAIMGRMAAYTGQEISREKALNSTELLMPNGVTLDMPTNAMQIAVPGLTKFS
jgi:predicted dehydrogenase